MRKAFYASVEQAMAEDDKIVLIIGDIGAFALRNCFERWPARCFNVGTCEQTMVGMAAGLAREGFYPIIHSIAPFLILRAYEQIKIDFGYQRLAGLFVSVGASYDYPSLGCTHSAPEVPPLLAMMDGMNVVLPSKADKVDGWVRYLCAHKILGYIQLAETDPIEKTGILHNYPYKGVIVAAGHMGYVADKACGTDIEVDIISVEQISPIDDDMIHTHCNRHARIMTIEPYINGHLANQIRKYTSHNPVIHQIGMHSMFDRFYGTRADHEKHHGLDVDHIRNTAKAFFA